jgi:hypothetical protein
VNEFHPNVKNSYDLALAASASGRMNIVAHFGVWLSRQFDASSNLSRTARTGVLRHPRNPEICANLT